MVKLQFDNNKQYKVTLPKALVEAKGWKKGTEIKILLDPQGNILLKVEDPIDSAEKQQHNIRK